MDRNRSLNQGQGIDEIAFFPSRGSSVLPDHELPVTYIPMSLTSFASRGNSGLPIPRGEKGFAELFQRRKLWGSIWGDIHMEPEDEGKPELQLVGIEFDSRFGSPPKPPSTAAPPPRAALGVGIDGGGGIEGG